MKNFVGIWICCFVFLTSVKAQMDQSVAPKTSKYSAHLFGKPAEIVLPPFSREEADKLDYNDSKNGHIPAVARNIATHINLNTAGTWTTLPNGEKVWRVQITGAGAQGLAPLFDQLYLPPGASLHIYTPLKEEVLGAFTNDNTPETRAFCCGLIRGESCIIEYYEPVNQSGKGIVSINKVGYAYRWLTTTAESMKSGSGTCEVNAVCPEGNNWRNQIRSVARIFVVADNNVDGWCSGAMVNNVRKDCTPYMLSAEHCTENGVTTAEYQQWVFYFNYQAATCHDTVGPQNDVVNGCKKIADSEDAGGSSGSDFLLIELNHAPPSAYNIYYSGWDVTNTTPQSGVGIHHPQADIKKISTYSGPAQSTAWGTIAQNTHWEVVWAVTSDGEGVTEPGSSGSPLYNSNSLIVGHLTGGGSCCAAGGCANGISPTAPDLFGKVSYDWTRNGVSSALQLKPWLDPDNTGTTTLSGMNPPCGGALPNDAGIQAITKPNGNVCSSVDSPVVVLRNFGANNLTSVTISFKYDNGGFSIFNWVGSLLPGTTTNISLPSATLSTGAHSFTVTTSLPNGQTDANAANNTLISNFYISNAGSLNLALTTDNAGSKTTWQIADAGSNVVASGGPYVNLAGGTTYNIPMCLPAGCYTFTIFSSTGNGMTQGENGNYVLSNATGTTTYAVLNNVSFGSQETDPFCIAAAAIDEIPAFRISIIPNPSSGQFNITVDNNEEKSFRVFDVTGRLIRGRKTSEQNLALDLTNESKGVYILQIETLSGKAVQKLVLK